MDYLKVGTINAASWFATIFSVQFAKDVLQIIALIASIGLTMLSAWWILRQNKLATERHERGQK